MKLCQVEAGQEEDIACEKFRLRVARASDQVIRYLQNLKFSYCSFLFKWIFCRYERGGIPLLCTSSPALSAPPPCHLCKAPRIFELQVVLHFQSRDEPWHFSTFKADPAVITTFNFFTFGLMFRLCHNCCLSWSLALMQIAALTGAVFTFTGTHHQP